MSEIPFIGDAFASPHSEYEPGPIVPPDVPPNFTPVNVPISCYWIPFVAGMIKAGLQEATWKTTSDSQLETVLGRWQDLLTIFEDAIQSSACASLLPPFACPYDFTVGDGFWTLFSNPLYTPPFNGFWFPVLGWTGTESTNNASSRCINRCTIAKSLGSAVPVTHVDFTYDLIKGTYDTNPSNLTGIVLFNGSTVVDSKLINSHDDPDGNGKVISLDTAVLADTVVIIVSSEDAAACGFPGNIDITAANILGRGSPTC